MSATIVNIFVHSYQQLTTISTLEIRLLLSWDSELLTSQSSSPKVEQRLLLFQTSHTSYYSRQAQCCTDVLRMSEAIGTHRVICRC